MKTTKPRASTRPLRVFIVEDHPDALTYLTMYLEASGHEVAHARGLVDAMKCLRQGEEWDVLLSDVNLPDGDGWQLMEQLRKLKRMPRTAIAMSGFGMGSDKAKSAAAGFSRHLVKPLDPDELDRALDDASKELTAKPARARAAAVKRAR
jgi:CheY-like chemotaxis protein